MTNESISAILAILGGLILLLWGVDRFVCGAAAVARNLRIPPLIIGLTVVGFGTSAPEILVSIVSSLQGNPGLAVGNALGSNIANISLVLGATAVVCPLIVKSEILRREYPVMFLIMLLALILVADNMLSRADGAILILSLLLMLYWVVKLGLRRHHHDPLAEEYDKAIPTLSTRRAVVWLVVGLLVLLVSSRALVWGSVYIAHIMGVSDLVIGLTIVAIGTSLPELVTSIVSAVRNEPDIAIGNVLGSNMFNLLVVLGLPGLISPHVLDDGVLSREFPVMFGLSVALFFMAYGIRGAGQINRIEGSLLLLSYGGYMSWLYFSTIA